MANNTQDRLKGFMDDILVQFSLGKAEAVEQFEKQKENLKSLIDMASSKLKESGDSFFSTDVGTKLNSQLEELKLQLALGKAESKDLFDKQSESISNSINSIKSDLSEKYPDLVKLLDDNTLKFNSAMEGLRLQYSLGKADLGDGVDSNKEMVTNKLNQLKQMFEEGKDIAQEKFDEFKDDSLKAFNSLKDTLINLRK